MLLKSYFVENCDKIDEMLSTLIKDIEVNVFPNLGSIDNGPDTTVRKNVQLYQESIES